ncbi:MAG: hypothetical protein IPK74_19175 [Deltaproteobacteria bacterium]|nr:hypothetical protein [Deltaproteobacteria bacterium]
MGDDDDNFLDPSQPGHIDDFLVPPQPGHIERIVEELARPLEDDAAWAHEQLAAATAQGSAPEEVQRWRRVHTRAVFALLEAGLWLFKQSLLTSLETETQPPGWATLAEFTPAELAMLRGEEYRLDAAGRAHARDARLRFIDDFKFMFRCMAKELHQTELASFGTKGMEDLRRAKAVRDRLMHPKRPEDLLVTDEEAACIGAALEFWETVHEELDAMAARTRTQLSDASAAQRCPDAVNRRQRS